MLECDAEFFVDDSKVVLSSPLALDTVVTCNGTHVLTATDVNNLERRSSAVATAVDEFNEEIMAAATAVVVFEQVKSLRTDKVVSRKIVTEGEVKPLTPRHVISPTSVESTYCL